MRFFPHLLLALAVSGLEACRLSAQEPATTSDDPLLVLASAQAPVDTACAPPCCAESCAPCRGGIIAGVGLYIMQPYFENNPAYFVEFENQNPPPKGTQTFHIVDRVDIAHQVEVAPLVWLGYLSEDGFGGRARYWYFRAGTEQALTFPPATNRSMFTIFSATPLGIQAFGDTLFQPKDTGPGTPEPTIVAITSKLELQVADLEALGEVQAGSWNFLLSGGVRLVRIDQNYNFYDLQPTTNPLVFRELLSGYTFQGAGPVLAAEVRRPFGDSGLALFSNARAAYLWGNARQDVIFGGTILRNDDANPQVFSENRQRGLPVLELEIGVEYGQQVGGSWVFGQFGVVGQDWLGAGNASRSAPNTFREGAPIGGVSDDSDIAFLGLTVRVGVNY